MGFDGGFDRGQVRGAAEEEGCFGEVGMQFAEAGGEVQGGVGHARGGGDGGEVGLQGVVVFGGGLIL